MCHLVALLKTYEIQNLFGRHHYYLYAGTERITMMSDLIRLLVSCYHANSLDEGVPRVVHARLDGLVQCVTVGSGCITELGIDCRCEVAGHAVVVFAQVWELRTA